EDEQGLFGAPTLQPGDKLDFGPGNFNAESPLADDFGEFASGFLTFEVHAKPGNFITSITLGESGIFRLFDVDEGGDPGDPFVDVSIEGVYQILAANNAPPTGSINFA